MERILSALLLVVLSSFCANASLRCEFLFADARLRSDTLAVLPSRDSGPGFIVPNEHFLGAHKATFASLAEGIYLTVGTERGLMSSALSGGKIKALVQVDRDDRVVLFNLINRALLAVSQNRQHYLYLRLKSSHKEWQDLVSSLENLSAEDRHILSRLDAWQWWNEQVQNNNVWQSFHRNPEQNSDQAYQYANYLFDDALFSQVSSLARSQRIYVVFDLLGTESLRLRVQQIAEALNLKLSIVDMSNAWQEGYLGHENTIRFFESLRPQLKLETQFLFTYLANPTSQNSVSSVFKYLFTTVSQHASLNEISMMLANMARVEPSRSNNQRSRVNRFDDF